MIKTIAGVVCLLTNVLLTFGQPNGQTRDLWKTYHRNNFLIGTHQAYVVTPKRPLPGNPWVWRASFPEWHTEMDSILLDKGFHLAYVACDDQYGNPASMQVWDKLYRYATDTLHLDRRPALEAVSRGALYALTWAKRNPDKVSCIYAETPVYDIKSWPGGKGKGPGDARAWQQLKQAYHFTEQQALNFKDNPVDNLEGLASFKIPVINVIGVNDQLVPSTENTDLLVQRYSALGGPATIYPVSDGPQQLQGHHFPIRNPEELAKLVFNYSYPVKSKLSYVPYLTQRGGIENFYKTVLKTKKATVAFLGGSITFNPGWRQMVMGFLRERFPDTRFKFIAAGIPSLGSLAHAFRLQRDVLDSGRVDLMFVEAAVNDRGSGVDSATQMHSLEGIVRHALRNNPAMNIIMMEFADTYKNADYDRGLIPGEVARHEAVASHYHLPSVNLAKEVHDKIAHGEFNWADDFKDIHPSPLGEALYFETIKEFLEISFPTGPSNLKLDVRKMPAPITKSSFEDGSYADLKLVRHDSRWTYDQDWTPKNQQATRDGFVHVPMLTAQTPGATLQFAFTGNAVGIAVVSGDDTGMIDYAIDGGQLQKLDLYTEFSSWLYLPYYQLLAKDLKNGKHTLTISVSPEKNPSSKGTACRIVHVLVNRKAKF